MKKTILSILILAIAFCSFSSEISLTKEDVQTIINNYNSSLSLTSTNKIDASSENLTMLSLRKINIPYVIQVTDGNGIAHTIYTNGSYFKLVYLNK
jgi:hypothetical protein